jgi:nitroreductase
MVTKDILEIAICAPSGDNVQPWKFRVGESFIDVFNIPENDMSVYNFRQSASFIAHGALLENISAIAETFGYRVRVTLFPDEGDPCYVAHVNLEKTNGMTGEKNDIINCIKLRATNRKPYKDTALTAGEKEKLFRAAGNEKAKLIIVDNKEKLRKLVGVTSNNERLVFSNRFLHDFFFGHMKWTEEEARGVIGFDVKTLELPLPAMVMFKFFRKWSRVKFFNKFGLVRVIGVQAEKLHATAPAMGAIIIPEYSPLLFIETGRVMQRVWLEATRLGLSIQPVTGILFFMQKIEANDHEEFLPEQTAVIKNSYKVMEEIFEPAGRKIIFLFRIGKSDPPSARTARLSLDQLLSQ